MHIPGVRLLELVQNSAGLPSIVQFRLQELQIEENARFRPSFEAQAPWYLPRSTGWLGLNQGSGRLAKDARVAVEESSKAPKRALRTLLSQVQPGCQ